MSRGGATARKKTERAIEEIYKDAIRENVEGVGVRRVWYRGE